jgi:pimeloyl-ACP methyl ester carboxylesterase
MKRQKLVYSKRLWLIVILSSAFLANGNLVSGQSPVKNIVLVHGAFADGSGWEGVYNILVKKGYSVSVVANPNTGLDADVLATKLVITRQHGPCILVGHSYGGAIITEAGNDSNVAGLVYVSAFAPDEGETLLKISQSGPPSPNSGILPPVDGFLWYDVSKFHSGFCADLPDAKAAFMAASQTPLAVSTFVAVFNHPAWKSKPSWYIVATEDQTIPPDGERFMAKRAGSKVTEIKGSHVVFISQPKAVAEVIEAAAAGSVH